MAQACMSGRQTVLMDQRGRISFPVIYRTAIGDSLYISPDQGGRGFLIVRSQEGYQEELMRIEQECIDEGGDHEEIEDARRDFSKDTANPTPDKNGRVTLDAKLLAHAGLHGRVVIIGVGSYAEIWDEERLVEYEKEREQLRKLKRAKKDAAKRARLAAENEA